MRGKRRLGLLQVIPVVLLVAVVYGLVHYSSRHTIALFDSAGPIAQKERNLIYFALALSLLVVVPVFVLLFAFAWRYREGNTRAAYSPNLEGSRRAEAIWWTIPTVLILMLSIVTWNSSHNLDPFRQLSSSQAPLRIQVISLDWKWLFIYPDQNIATVNELYVPLNTPVNFELTSDSVMNSFWIPQLGGQIYTMPGMMTQLHLMAQKPGIYRGQSANISGKGFAGMVFNVHAASRHDFDAWVTDTKHSSYELTSDVYGRLALPSENSPVFVYRRASPDLFQATIDKYMGGMHMHMGTS